MRKGSKMVNDRCKNCMGGGIEWEVDYKDASGVVHGTLVCTNCANDLKKEYPFALLLPVRLVSGTVIADIER
jgi:hypothetical protein